MTETFTGTVNPGSSDWHPFTINVGNGLLNVTLTDAGPPATIYMGLALGAATDTSCTLFTNAQFIVQAATAPQVSGTAGTGRFCVAVYDVGNQSADVTYSVTVTHY